MAGNRAYLDFVIDLLADFDGVTARRMFGGYGLFRDGLMFGLIADDTLYLKTDEANRAAFEDAGTGPFVYSREGREIALSYHEAPSELFDDADELVAWSRAAFEAALRAQRKP